MKLRFDFNAAAAFARKAFPEATANTTFVDNSSPDARQQIIDWLTKHKYKPLEDFAAEAERTLKFEGQVHTISRHMLLTMDSSSKRKPVFLTVKHEADKFFTFFHELGHIVTAYGLTIAFSLSMIEKHAASSLRETCADMFAAIYGIRHGWLTMADIQHIAVLRSLQASLGQFDYITHPALEWLLMEHQKTDFKSMTHEEMVGFVNENAPKISPDRKQIKSICKAFNRAAQDLIASIQQQGNVAENGKNKFFKQIMKVLEYAPAHSLEQSMAGQLLFSMTSMQMSLGNYDMTPPPDITQARVVEIIANRALEAPGHKPKRSYLWGLIRL